MTYDIHTSARDVIRDLQDHVRGKAILVTGASPGGIGAHLVEAIAESPSPPSEIIIAVRSKTKGQEEQEKVKSINPDIKTSVLELDLASFASVRKAAKEINQRQAPIDVLVNNAGVMAVPYAKTEDGIETQLQANHLGHFLFTNLILGKILESESGGRIVNVSSDGYRLGHVRYLDYGFHDGEFYDKWAAYGQSKTAQMLFSMELARRYGHHGLQSYSVHPGVVMSTSLGSHVPKGEEESAAFWKTLSDRDKLMGMPQGWEGMKPVRPDQGVATQALAAFSPDLKDDNGSYLHYCQVCPHDEVYPWALGEREARKCWALSEKLVGQDFRATK